MPFALGNSELSCGIAGLSVPVLGMPYPERDLAGISYSMPRSRVRPFRDVGGCRGSWPSGSVLPTAVRAPQTTNTRTSPALYEGCRREGALRRATAEERR